jgi:hypothetical protein
MAGFSTLDAYIAATTKSRNFHKASLTTKGAGFHHSLWKADGFPRAASTPPTGAGESPTSATSGAIKIANATSGYNNHLVLLGAHATKSTISLYDRLWHNSGLSGTSTSLQSFSATALTRYTDGAEVELWLEVYTALGGTATTFTAIYTNQAGTGSKSATYSTAEFGTPATAGLMVPFKLADGDTGVRSVQSVQLSGTTGTTGDFGLVLLRRIGNVLIDIDNIRRDRDFLGLGTPEIVDDACLALMHLGATTSTGTIYGDIYVKEAAE